MMLRFWIDNFKSLVNFALPPSGDKQDLGSFCCLVGLNGAGKSTILQAFDFISRLPDGRIDDWLKERKWKKSDLGCKLSRKATIRFELVIQHQAERVEWSGTFNLNTFRCTAESIQSAGMMHLRVHEGELKYHAGDAKITRSIQDFDYQGSILSILKIDPNLSPQIAAVRHFTAGLKSLELLNPQLIKNRAREGDDIGIGGEKLTAYLYAMPQEKRQLVIQELKHFYPRIIAGTSGRLQAGWKTFKVVETYAGSGNDKLETETLHLNDGLLRLLAILSQMQSDKTFILLDEIENGINPELIEQLMDYLVQSGRQVLVTTHSPMVLNYLEDDVARNGVFLVSKSNAGITKTARFFSHPETAKKLGIMGPGEVFVDSDLEAVGTWLESAPL